MDENFYDDLGTSNQNLPSNAIVVQKVEDNRDRKLDLQNIRQIEAILKKLNNKFCLILVFNFIW